MQRESTLKKKWKEIILSIAMVFVALFGILVFLTYNVIPRPPAHPRKGATEAIIKHFSVILDDFKHACGAYPNTEQGLNALLEKPQGLDCTKYPYDGFVTLGGGESLASVFRDAWGDQLKYTSDGKTYRIESVHGVVVKGP